MQKTTQKTTLEMARLARITRNAHGYDFLSIPRRNDATREIYSACGSIRVATRDTETGTINSDEWIVEQLNSVKVGEFVIHHLKNFEGALDTKWTKIESDCWSAL